MNDKIHLNISKPFGPSLGKVNIPKNLIIKINNYIDEIIDKLRTGITNYSKSKKN